MFSFCLSMSLLKALSRTTIKQLYPCADDMFYFAEKVSGLYCRLGKDTYRFERKIPATNDVSNYVRLLKSLQVEGRFMYHIHRKGQSLYEKDGGKHNLFDDSDVESDDEDYELRKEYVLKALGLRKDHSKKKYRQIVRGKGISKISDKI